MEKLQATDIVGKILADAQRQAQEITANGEQKLAALQAQHGQNLAKLKNSIQATATEKADDTRSRMLSAARMEISRSILAEKRKLIEEVFAAVRQRIIEMPAEQYRQMLEGLLKKSISSANEEMIAGKHEKYLDQALVDKVNSSLGPKGNVRLSASRGSFDMGFILSGGRTRINCSIDALLEEAKSALEMEIGKILFQ